MHKAYSTDALVIVLVGNYYVKWKDQNVLALYKANLEVFFCLLFLIT